MRLIAVLAPSLLFSLACTGILGGDTATDTGGGGGGAEVCKWFRDQDGDGFGDPEKDEKTCEKPAGYVADDTDCDDEDTKVHPGAKEVCDDVDADEDCNGKADEADEDLELTVWYADTDGDGFGDADETQRSCDQPSDYVENADDCDDTDRKTNPDGQEVCDGEGGDEDCDGKVDSEDSSMDDSNLPTWYRDSDNDGFGDPDATTKEQCDEPSGYAINDEDCDDSDKNVNPDETEVCGNGTDDNCNGSSDGCGLTGEYELGTEADVRITGPTSGSLGYSVCGGGDIDGDGMDDIVAGAPSYSSDGVAYAFYGGASGALTESAADVRFTGEANGDQFGVACAFGDWDNDGKTDVALSDFDYQYTSSYTHGGRVYMFQTPISSAESAGSADVIYTNNYNASDYLGNSLSSGDWNGDGKDDLMVGAVENYVFIDYGTVSTSSGKDIFGINEFEGAITYSGVVASGGDTDGDGSDDLVVTDSSSKGAAYLFVGEFGGAVSLSAYTEATITGSGNSDALGVSAALDGDLNGDGYDDLLVSASYVSNGTGAVYGCFGPLSGTSAGTACDLRLSGPSSLAYFGWDVAYVGDENGDGDTDILVGSTGMDGTGTDSGRAYLFRGPLSGAKAASTADATFLGSGNYASTGASVDGAGDFNGDGNDDLLIGAYSGSSSKGQVFIMFGGGF